MDRIGSRGGLGGDVIDTGLYLLHNKCLQSVPRKKIQIFNLRMFVIKRNLVMRIDYQADQTNGALSTLITLEFSAT